MTTRTKKKPEYKLHYGPNKKLSEKLKGRTSKRLGQRSVPMAAKLNGFKQIPKPDPNLKPIRKDVFFVVTERREKIDVKRVRGRLLADRCCDCGSLMCVDERLMARAIDAPERQARQVEFMCADCLKGYQR